MTRIKQGYIARRRRTKIHLFLSSFRGAHSRLTRTVTQQKIRALVSAHRDRDRKKRAFRLLWITRINVVIRERGVSYSYNRLIHNLYKRQLLLNRKILSLSHRLLPRRSSHSSCPWEKWKELGGWSTLFPKK